MSKKKYAIGFILSTFLISILAYPVLSQNKPFHLLEDIYVNTESGFKPLSDYFEFTKDTVRVKSGKKFCVGSTCGLPGGGGSALSNPVTDVLLMNNIEDLESGKGIYVDKSSVRPSVSCDSWNWVSEYNETYHDFKSIESWTVKNNSVFVLYVKTDGNRAFARIFIDNRSFVKLYDNITELMYEDSRNPRLKSASRHYVMPINETTYLILRVFGVEYASDDYGGFTVAEVRDKYGNTLLRKQINWGNPFYRDYRIWIISYEEYYFTSKSLDVVVRVAGDEYRDDGEGDVVKFIHVVFDGNEIKVEQKDVGRIRSSYGVSATLRFKMIYDTKNDEALMLGLRKTMSYSSRNRYYELLGIYTRRIANNGAYYDRYYGVSRLGNTEDYDIYYDVIRNGYYATAYLISKEEGYDCRDDHEIYALIWNRTNLILNSHYTRWNYGSNVKSIHALPEGVFIEHGTYNERPCDRKYYTQFIAVRDAYPVVSYSYNGIPYTEKKNEFMFSNTYADFVTENEKWVRFGNTMTFVNSCNTTWTYNIDKSKFVGVPSQIYVSLNSALDRSILYYKKNIYSDISFYAECYDGSEWKECGGFIPEKVRILAQKPFGFNWPYLVILYQ